MFGDPLLHRVAGEMRLTDRAEALKSPLDAALSSIAAMFRYGSGIGSDPHQTIRLVIADQPGRAKLESIVLKIKLENPSIDLVLLPWRCSDDALYRLETGEADIAVSDFGLLAPKYRQIELRVEPYVVAMRRAHPAVRDFDLQKWLSWPHIVVSGNGSKRGSIEDVLGKHKLRRHVGAVVPHFTMIEPLLLQTDFISCAPRSTLSGPNLLVMNPPVSIPDFELHVAWHSRRDEDASVQAVVKVITSSLGWPIAD